MNGLDGESLFVSLKWSGTKIEAQMLKRAIGTPSTVADGKGDGHCPFRRRHMDNKERQTSILRVLCAWWTVYTQQGYHLIYICLYTYTPTLGCSVTGAIGRNRFFRSLSVSTSNTNEKDHLPANRWHIRTHRRAVFVSRYPRVRVDHTTDGDWLAYICRFPFFLCRFFILRGISKVLFQFRSK